MTGLTQTKISRSENAKVTPTALEAERIARALGASDEARKSLTALAHDLAEPVSVFSRAFDAWEVVNIDDCVELDSDARLTTMVESHLIPVAMQTPEYSLAFREISGANRQLDSVFVAANQSRQARLFHKNRSGQYIVTSETLTRRFAPWGVWLEQLRQVRRLALHANIDFGVLLPDVRLRALPRSEIMYDNRINGIDDPACSDRAYLTYDHSTEFRRTFDELATSVLWEADAVRYLDDLIAHSSSIDLRETKPTSPQPS